MSQEEDPPRPVMFKENIIQLFDVLIRIITPLHEQQITSINPTLLTFGKGFIKQFDPETIIDTFINKSHMHWEKISERNDKFFIENANNIFGELPIGNVDIFADIFKSNNVEPDDIEILWEFFDAFVGISILHVHDQREPYMKEVVDDNNNVKYVKSYKNRVYMDIKNLNTLGNKFSVKLNWE